jgi:lipooligosaccharide transport system ATP-binding protein
MDGGKIAAEGPPHVLIDRYSTREVVELRFAGADYEEMGTRLGGLARRHEVLPDRLLLYSDDGEALVEEVRRSGIAPERTLVRRSSLEDVFLYLTGRSLVE